MGALERAQKKCTPGLKNLDFPIDLIQEVE